MPQTDKNTLRFAALMSVIGWFAVIAQYYLNIQNQAITFSEITIRFFSYFTILTNLLVALSFSSMAFKSNHAFAQNLTTPKSQTAITVYIIVVGAVYNLVLRPLWHPEGLQRLVDELLHSVVPTLTVVFWILVVRKKSIGWSVCITGLTYPFVYTVFIAIRGYYSGFYPYPFVNVTALGYPKVLMNGGILLLFFICLFGFLIGISKLTGSKK
jgi:hypothetical protein